MLAVIYRAWVTPKHEDQYRQNWQIIADYFATHRGAIGSTLHQSSSGYYVIYSRWPDRMTWENAWPSGDEAPPTGTPERIQAAIADIKQCIDEEKEHFPEIITEVIAETQQR